MKLKNWLPGRTRSSRSKRSDSAEQRDRWRVSSLGRPRGAPAGNGNGTACQVHAAEPDRESQTGADRGPGKATASLGEKVSRPCCDGSRPRVLPKVRDPTLCPREPASPNSRRKRKRSDPGSAVSRKGRICFRNLGRKLPNSSGPRRWKKRTISITGRASRKPGSMKHSIPPGCPISVSSRRRHRPTRAKRDLKKIVIGLAGGGLAIGLALALLIELVLDRTIKRPLELETRLRIPLLLSIPNFGFDGQRLRLHDAGDDSEAAIAQNAGPSGDRRIAPTVLRSNPGSAGPLF